MVAPTPGSAPTMTPMTVPKRMKSQIVQVVEDHHAAEERCQKIHVGLPGRKLEGSMPCEDALGQAAAEDGVR